MKFAAASIIGWRMTQEEVEHLRLAFNEAHREWKKSPTEDTKAAVKAASSAYCAAREKAQLPPLRPLRLPPADEHPSVTEARERKNEALRAMYAQPSPHAKKACLDADNEYKRLRRLHDPDYRAKEIAAVKRSMEKRKLGLGGKASK